MTVVVSKPNMALAVTPFTEQLRNMFPEAKTLEDPRGDWAIIKHGLAEHILLRRLGIRNPNPMGTYYSYPAPAGEHAFSVQRITGNLLSANPRAYVLNDMGTGKTRTALWTWDFLNTHGYAKRLLIVAPRSTLTITWMRECFATLPFRKAVVLYGTKAKRLERLTDPLADIFIINHDGLRVIDKELAARTDIDVLVLDELATYRNKNPRSEHVRRFVDRFAFVWGMTGSPMPNGPMDVWQQCRIVTPHTVPKYKTHARDMLMNRVNEYLWVPKQDAVKLAYSWMQPAVRFNLDDVVELPETIARFVDIPMGPQQAHVYKNLANDFVAAVHNKTITAMNAGVAMSKLMQISSGWVYTTEEGSVKLDNDERLETLANFIMEAPKKVLVFCAFKITVAGISEYLTKQNIEHACVHGDVGDAARDRIFNAFQNSEKYKVIVAHPGCMSHGLTLTAADTVIWFGPILSYDNYDQANARIRRIGQKHRQQIVHLQSSPVERKIYKMMLNKENFQAGFLGLFEEATLREEE